MKRGRVAQLVEPSAHNRTGGGSNPSPSTIKKDRLRKYFKVAEDYRPIEDELFKAVNKGRVKSGALLVYCLGENYGYKKINEAILKACKPGSKTRMKDVLSIRDWNYYINNICEYKEKLIAFLNENKES